jgi:hypothetical protein
MLLFVVLTVFLAGLMVGRTPEYLGKKIEAREVKLAVLAILVMPSACWPSAALGVLPGGAGLVPGPGPHGLSELLYAYSSATGNNGSAFAGSPPTDWHNTDAGHRHAARPLRLHHPDPRHRRLARRQEDGARLGRHLPDPRAALRHPARRDDPDRRRADLLPVARAGPDRRAGRRSLAGQTSEAPHDPANASLHRKSACSTAGILSPRAAQAFAKLDPRGLCATR